jgi:hypothetical protein
MRTLYMLCRRLSIAQYVALEQLGRRGQLACERRRRFRYRRSAAPCHAECRSEAPLRRSANAPSTPDAKRVAYVYMLWCLVSRAQNDVHWAIMPSITQHGAQPPPSAANRQERTSKSKTFQSLMCLLITPGEQNITLKDRMPSMPRARRMCRRCRVFHLRG